MKNFLLAILIACALALAWGNMAHAQGGVYTYTIPAVENPSWSFSQAGSGGWAHLEYSISPPVISTTARIAGYIYHTSGLPGDCYLKQMEATDPDNDWWGSESTNRLDVIHIGYNCYVEGDIDSVTCQYLVGKNSDAMNFQPSVFTPRVPHLGAFEFGFDCTGSGKADDFRWVITDTMPIPSCSTGILTDTHFLLPTTWTGSGGASWTGSIWTLPVGGSVAQSGMFTQTGIYSITVLARAYDTVATLSAGIGASSSSTSVSTGAFSTYYLTATVDTAGMLSVFASASGGQIQVDQICVSPSQSGCMMVIDPDFRVQSSWIPFGSVAWTDFEGGHAGVWVSGAQFSLNQNIPEPMMTSGGNYSVTLLAKAGSGTTLIISVDSTPSGYITITPSADYAYFSGVFSVTTSPSGENHNFSVGRLTADGSLALDYLCIYPGNILYGAGPCGMTPAMVAESHRFIYNSDFADGLHLPWPNLSIAFPLGIGVMGSDVVFMPASWNYGTYAGLYRTQSGGNAVGLLPQPLHAGFFQEFHTSMSGGYNVFLRMKRNYANANLIVGDQSTALTPKGEWTDFGFYQSSGSMVRIQANCIDLNSGSPNWCVEGDNTSGVISVDDVYVVPGPEMACGTMITTPFTPLGGCINPDRTFEAGAGTWEVGNGARIMASEADIPSGGYIRQYVPISTDSSTWQQLVDSLAVGGNYTITIAARAQDTSNSLLVAVGAYTPGEIDLDTSDFSSSSMVTEWSGNFTMASNMVVGSGMPLQITAKDGGTLIVFMVCIRSESSTPPVGECLGSWSASDGDALSRTISPPAYVFNSSLLAGGQSYNLTATGTRPGAGKITISFVNLGIVQFSVDVTTDTDFNVTQAFVAPQMEEGRVRIDADGDVVYTSLCLQENNGLPVIAPPGPLPYPECVTESGLPIHPAPNAGFFMLGQYSVTNEYSDTATTPAAYMAELTYNYAIYPLVCTTISIANWQYAAYQSLLALLKQWFGPGSWLEKWLSDILDAIRAIQIPPSDGGGGSTLWDILLWILKMLLALLLKILGIVGMLFSKLLEGAKSINNEVRSDSAVMYPIDCTGDGQWMCFGFAALLAANSSFGDWLNIIALIVNAMLTVSLTLWVLNQVRAMFEPGSGEAD
jgi:hypothetical protein